MATAYLAPIDPPEWDDYMTDGRYDHQKALRVDDDYIKSLAAMAKRNGASDLLGEVVRWGRGDGVAAYMVWNTRPLELIHLALGDAWQVEDALIRGLRLSDIQQMVKYDRLINTLPEVG